jgi:uncharacterized membrane protein YhaH (DUF805 family)
MEWYLKVLKNYDKFGGRARRKEYWMFVLFNLIVSIVLGIVDTAVGTEIPGTNSGIIGTIYSLVVLLPSLAVAVRRMHDVGKSGWFILIPIYNFILSVSEGDTGSNEYGPDPKDEVSADSDSLDSHLID